MKLTSEQVQKALTQYDGQPIPEDHQLVPRLNERYGDHTFFLDTNGLNIVEPADEPAVDETQAARVVNLANWSDENCNRLVPHEPEPTETFVELVDH
jgi:hypothetical protein